ncbi:hypothetical protein FDECE_3338 [Fusarium decemcellulare]|nr:hypothetical protein FDECE_3338 [Fusarium decemcellulare]
MGEIKPYKSDDGDVYLWTYLPSFAAGSIFAALFMIATIIVKVRLIKIRTRFSIPFALGGVAEHIGYGARAYCAKHTDKLGPFAIQSILILVAPAFYAASIYMVLSRLMMSVRAERFSIIPARWLTKIFVVGDILSFLVQSAGGSMMTMQNIKPSLAKTVVIIGLFIQVGVFSIFIVTAITFHVRMRRWPLAQSLDGTSTWRTTMGMMYATCFLIMLRSSFRIVEFMLGQDGYLMHHEWPLYAFDSALMFTVMVIYGVWYPGNLKKKPTSVEMQGFLGGYNEVGRKEQQWPSREREFAPNHHPIH